MLKEKFPVKEVILFGSKARGDSDEESDIDLLLVTTRSIHWRERQTIIYSVSWTLKNQISRKESSPPSPYTRKSSAKEWPPHDNKMW